MGPVLSIDELSAFVADLVAGAGHPAVVGVSGYGGAGKSTLARRLTAEMSSAYRLRGDDFLVPARSHLHSSDWDGVDRERLVDTVLRPFRDGRRAVFQRYDWDAGILSSPEELPMVDVLVVDAVGLIHPTVEPYLDLSVWVDVDSDTATARGKARDRSFGRAHDALWDEVWAPNDLKFDSLFGPRERADVVVPNP